MRVQMTPMLLLHIVMGTLGCLTGYAALLLRKGGGWHARVGAVFAVAMILLGLSGTYLAVFAKFNPGNVLGGVTTAYMVGTGWATVRRRSPVGRWDKLALLLPIATGTAGILWAVQATTDPSGMKYGLPPYPFILMATVSLLGLMGDLRMLVRGGITGTARIARHLWRMCFGLFVAAISIFLARAHLFPMWMRKSGILWMLTMAPVLAMIFYLVRIRVAKTWKRRTMIVKRVGVAA